MPTWLGITFTQRGLSFLAQISYTVLNTGQRKKDQMIESIFLLPRSNYWSTSARIHENPEFLAIRRKKRFGTQTAF